MLQNKLILLFLLLVCCCTAEAAVVRKIIWESDLPFDEYRRLIKVSEGKELNARQIRHSIKRLYATGRFEQVAVIKQLRTDGITLVFSAKALLFIDDLTIKGNATLTDSEIKLAAAIKAYGPVYENSIEKMRDEILYLYRQEGFPSAQASIEVRKIGSSKAEIIILIEEGVRRKLSLLTIEGTISPQEAVEVQNEIKLRHPFAALTETVIRDIADEVETRFRSKGMLDVSVKTEISAEGVLQLQIASGPLYRFDLQGTGSFAPPVITELLASVENWQANIENAAARLKLFYHAAGFIDAKVLISREESRGELEGRPIHTIQVTVQEGHRRFLDDISFIPPNTEDMAEIKQMIYDYIYERLENENFPLVSIDRGQNGGYRDTDGTRRGTNEKSRENRVTMPGARYAIPVEYLPDLKNYIETLYHQRGYAGTLVNLPQITGEGDNLFLYLDILEGTRTMLTWAEVQSGDTAIDRELNDIIDLRTEIPYIPGMIDDYKGKMLEVLEAKGYLYARILEQVEQEQNRVKVLFTIDNLFPVTAGEVVVNGNYVTEGSVILRMLRFEQNATLTRGGIDESRQNLLRSGIFDMVEISFIDEELPHPKKDIVVILRESVRLRLDVGAGISSDEGGKLFGSVEYRNILSRALNLRFAYKGSMKIPTFMGSSFEEYWRYKISWFEKLDRTITASFIVPDLYFLPFSLSLQTELFHIHDTRQSAGTPYMLDKNGITTSLYRYFGKHYYLSFGLELARQDEERYIEKETSYAYENTSRYIIAPELQGYIDFRDDIVFPIKGFKVGFKLRNVTSFTGTPSFYTNLENYYSVYVPLIYRQLVSGSYVPRDLLIFHTFIKYAFLIEHAGTLTADDYLKLGGSASIRGFNQDSIVPDDYTPAAAGSNEEPLKQGTIYLFARNELRLKIQNNLYIVGFFDAGNLWENIENVGKNDLLRFGAGGGVMLVSPIGSINLQAGFNLFPKESEKESWAFHFFISSF